MSNVQFITFTLLAKKYNKIKLTIIYSSSTFISFLDSRQFSRECGSSEILVELWRVISKPNIDRPDSFGTAEYFDRDQHCENPNPDLLAKHGSTVKVITDDTRDDQIHGLETVEFYHVVEREYMIRICPCIMSHCTCETVPQDSQVCSKIFEVCT